ncbi:unnamed protein product [Victoria cruziana]
MRKRAPLPSLFSLFVFAATFFHFFHLLPLPSFIPLVFSEWRAHWISRRGLSLHCNRFRVESTLPVVRCMQQQQGVEHSLVAAHPHCNITLMLRNAIRLTEE